MVSNRLGRLLLIPASPMDGWDLTVDLRALKTLLLSSVMLIPSYGTGEYSLLLSISLIISHYSPVGVFEFEKFANASKAVMDAVVMATEKGATSIIGQSLCTVYH